MGDFELTDEMRVAVYKELFPPEFFENEPPKTTWANVPEYSIVSVEPDGQLWWYEYDYIFPSSVLAGEGYKGEIADSYELRELIGGEDYKWWKNVLDGSIVELSDGSGMFWYSDGALYKSHDDMISSTNGFDASDVPPPRVLRPPVSK